MVEFALVRSVLVDDEVSGTVRPDPDERDFQVAYDARESTRGEAFEAWDCDVTLRTILLTSTMTTRDTMGTPTFSVRASTAPSGSDHPR